MYAYIEGIIRIIKPSSVVIENNGIGYLITSANPYEYRIDEKVKVFIYQIVRDDQITLYGFRDQERLDLFIKLLSVRGIGPKSALSIIAYDHPNDIISAIETGNITFLTKFPGIGNKTAQQIILDLKGKLNLAELANIINPVLEEVELALLSLGYRKTEVTKVLKKIDNNITVEQGIKQALSLLIK